MYQLAIQNLRGRPVRTSLAILGMTIAIFVYVGLFSVSRGIDYMVHNTLNRAPGLIAMQRGAPIPLFSVLPKDWILEIEKMPEVHAGYTECWTRINVIDNEVVISPPRLLCGTDIARRLKLKTKLIISDMKSGRFLNETDVGTFNAVVSRQIAEQFQKKVGDNLEVNGQIMHIVGTYETGSLLLDVCIFIDQGQFRTITSFDENSVSSFYIEQHEGIKEEDLDSLAKKITDHFRDRKLKQESSFTKIITGKNRLESITSAVSQFLAGKPGQPDNTDKTKAENSKAVISADSSSNDKFSGKYSLKNKPHAKVDISPIEIKPAIQWAGRFGHN